MHSNAQIADRRVSNRLIKPEPERRKNAQKVLKCLGLDSLEIWPSCGADEGIDFQRHASSAAFKLPDNDEVIVAGDKRSLAHVGENVGSKKAKVGEATLGTAQLVVLIVRLRQ